MEKTVKNIRVRPTRFPLPVVVLYYTINLDNQEHILALLEKDKLTETDRVWLLDHEDELRAVAQEKFIAALKAGHQPPSAHAKAMWENLAVGKGSTGPAILVHRTRLLPAAWLRYAAAILILLGTGAYLFYAAGSKQKIANELVKPIYPDIKPGGNKAILTLADGSNIVLDGSANGAVAKQGNTKILKQEDGYIKYETGSGPAKTLGYNTITTPRGGQYHVLLPDGSQVWLNAVSSIRFPTAFGKDRKVTITGEAYFEIVKDKDRPFLVTANALEVNVLGTSFNVNAYDDENAVTTTLVEGSVSIKQAKENVVLKPGQQARINAGEAISIIDNANVPQVMAWKNGEFNFQDASVEEVMRQLSRWYDLEVVYEKGIPGIKFYGSMGRNLTLASVLRGLEMSKVHFKIEGRKMTVMP